MEEGVKGGVRPLRLGLHSSVRGANLHLRDPGLTVHLDASVLAPTLVASRSGGSMVHHQRHTSVCMAPVAEP